ncbi:MAG: hypothetical protein RBR08_00075 [Desulforegulaceae bacterium]|nr:hypothetical protein [Desulforegulaceae bacterium]
MKKIILFIFIVLLFFCDRVCSFEKINPEKLKSVIGQTGINDGFKSVFNPHTSVYDEEKQSEEQEQKTPDLMNSRANFGDITIKRGAGVSIFVDDVVLLLRSMPDTTFWDSDGVR